MAIHTATATATTFYRHGELCRAGGRASDKGSASAQLLLARRCFALVPAVEGVRPPCRPPPQQRPLHGVRPMPGSWEQGVPPDQLCGGGAGRLANRSQLTRAALPASAAECKLDGEATQTRLALPCMLQEEEEVFVFSRSLPWMWLLFRSEAGHQGQRVGSQERVPTDASGIRADAETATANDCAGASAAAAIARGRESHGLLERSSGRARHHHHEPSRRGLSRACLAQGPNQQLPRKVPQFTPRPTQQQIANSFPLGTANHPAKGSRKSPPLFAKPFPHGSPHTYENHTAQIHDRSILTSPPASHCFQYPCS